MNASLPIPEWDGERWIPTPKLYKNQGEWPEGFDPVMLDRPQATLGEVIAFRVRGSSVLTRMQVQRITYAAHPFYLDSVMIGLNPVAKVALEAYQRGGIRYSGPVQSGHGARGHWTSVTSEQLDSKDRRGTS